MAISKIESDSITSSAVTTDKISAGAIGVSDLGTQVQSALGTRNLIINGDMRIAQRGTSVSTPASTYGYCVDRFYSRGNSNTANTQTQSTDAPSGFGYSLNVVRDSGQTGGLIRLQQVLETINIIHLRSQVVTLSFYAKLDSGATNSDLHVNLYTGNGTERKRGITAYDNELIPIDEVSSLTTGWQKFTYTSSALMSDLSQLTIEFNYLPSGTASSNDGYFITGVQLEIGDTATPFEHRPYDMELARCQRYFYRGTYWGSGIADGSRNLTFMVNLPVSMRAQPSVTNAADSSGIAANTSLYNLDGASAVIYNLWWNGSSMGINVTTSVQITQYTIAAGRLADLQCNAEL